MKKNVLYTMVSGIAKKFIVQIYPSTGKCFLDAATGLFNGLLLGGSTLVTELAVFAGDGKTMYKGVQEKVSRWLSTYDFAGRAGEWMLEEHTRYVEAYTTIAVDGSDISKEFGGKGMEGMANGYDGSRGVIARGHSFLGAVAVGSSHANVYPLHFQFTPGRKGMKPLWRETIRTIVNATKGRGIFAMDRGEDSSESISFLQSLGCQAVVRIKEFQRDVFGTGERIDRAFDEIQQKSMTLRKAKGAEIATLQWRLGYFGAWHTPLLVVKSVVKGRAIYLYVVLPAAQMAMPETFGVWAHRAAQAYMDRWQIEVFFERIKQDFSLEAARVRTFKRLRNLFYLCVLGYVFCIHHLPFASKREHLYKIIKDNMRQVSTSMQALLGNIRALIDLPRIRYISGRPRAAPRDAPLQLFLHL